MDISNYHPAPHVLDHIGQTDFVAIVGPTAVGKTTLIKAAVAREPRLHMLVTDTSRARREGEQEGVDFHFVTREYIADRTAKGEYVTCVAGATGDLYATAPEEYPAGKITLLATLSYVVADFRKLPYKSFHTIFVLPPSYAVWQERLGRHRFDTIQLQRRLVEAEQSLTFGLEDQRTHFVINDDLALATEDLITIALDLHEDARQQADQPRARKLARQQLEALRSLPE